MKPNPIDGTVQRSIIILHRRTAPCLSNRERMSCSVTFGLRFPTRMLFTMAPFSGPKRSVVAVAPDRPFSSARILVHFWRRRGIQKRALLLAASPQRRPQAGACLRFFRSYRLLRLRGAQGTLNLG